MPNLRPIVLPGLPHHICHRGNLRQTIFFRDSDRQLFLDLLAEHSRHHGVSIQAWCLMPNHVHVIAIPHDLNGLHYTFERVEGDYARSLHIRFIAADICGRAVSDPRRWTKNISGRQCFTSNSIRCVPAWRRLPSIGAGRAREPGSRIVPAICWTRCNGAPAMRPMNGVNVLGSDSRTARCWIASAKAHA
jgi:REP element-mobilizing transposase RayT